MNKEQATPYISHYIDDCLAIREAKDMPTNATLVGWQCGFEPMFVAVWSGYGWQVNETDAEEIATDYLEEIGWFSEQATLPDYVIQ